MTPIEDDLRHYGVKGMKWGVRKQEKARAKRNAKIAKKESWGAKRGYEYDSKTKVFYKGNGKPIMRSRVRGAIRGVNHSIANKGKSVVVSLGLAGALYVGVRTLTTGTPKAGVQELGIIGKNTVRGTVEYGHAFVTNSLNSRKRL